MEDPDGENTPRSGRKKKSLLSKMAQRKKNAKNSDESDSGSKVSLKDESLTTRRDTNGLNGNDLVDSGDNHRDRRALSPDSSSSFTQVSVDPSPVNHRSPRRSVEMDPIPDASIRAAPRVVESIDGDEHSVRVSRPSPSPLPRPRGRKSDNADATADDSDNRPGPSGHVSQSARSRTGDSPTGEKSQVVESDGSGFNSESELDSDDDDDQSVEQMRTEYENLLAGTSTPLHEQYELTRENLDRKADLERARLALESGENAADEKRRLSPPRADILDTSFGKMSRTQRLTNFSRSAAMTPNSDIGSERSYATQSSLPLITTKSVRERY